MMCIKTSSICIYIKWVTHETPPPSISGLNSVLFLFILSSPRRSTFEEEEMDNVALRTYELGKLRYYFAIAVLDSPRTAEALYSQLDGIEFEHSAMVFDMRFVPDDVSFSDRKPRDVCSAAGGASYKPPDFVVKALTVSIVWYSIA
jgi:hypothetical protein